MYDGKHFSFSSNENIIIQKISKNFLSWFVPHLYSRKTAHSKKGEGRGEKDEKGEGQIIILNESIFSRINNDINVEKSSNINIQGEY